MAAPEVRTGHQSTFQSSGSSIGVPRPTTYAAGDRLVLWLIVEFVGNFAAPTITAPTGFELAETTSSQHTSFSGHLYRYEKVADGTEPATLTSAFGTTASYSGALVLALSPCEPGPAAEQTNDGASSTLTYPSVTTTEADSLILRCCEAQKAPDGTPTGSFTGELWYDDYSWWGYLTQVSPGAVGTATDDLASAADVWCTQTASYHAPAAGSVTADAQLSGTATLTAHAAIPGAAPEVLLDIHTERYGAYPGVDGSSGKIAVPVGLQDGDGVLLYLLQFCEHSGDDPGTVYVHEGTSVSDDNDPPGALISSTTPGSGFVVFAPAAQEPSPIYRPWGTVAWGVAGDGTGGTFDRSVTHWDVKWSPSPNPGTYPDGLPDTAVNLYALPLRAQGAGRLAVDAWAVTSDAPETDGSQEFVAAEVTTTRPNCRVVTAFLEGWEPVTSTALGSGYELLDDTAGPLPAVYDAWWAKSQATPGATGAPSLAMEAGDHPNVSYIAITAAVAEASTVAASAQFSGTATVAADATRATNADTGLTATAAVSAAATLTVHTDAQMAGSASVTVAAGTAHYAAAQLSARATLTAAATTGGVADAQLGATATMTAAGHRIAGVDAQVAGSATVGGSAALTLRADLQLDGIATLVAVGVVGGADVVTADAQLSGAANFAGAAALRARAAAQLAGSATFAPHSSGIIRVLSIGRPTVTIPVGDPTITHAAVVARPQILVPVGTPEITP